MEFNNEELNIIKDLTLFKININHLKSAIGKKNDNYLSSLKMVAKYLASVGFSPSDINKYLFKYCVVLSELSLKGFNIEKSFFKDLIQNDYSESEFLSHQYITKDLKNEDEIYYKNLFNDCDCSKIKVKDKFLNNCFTYYNSSFNFSKGKNKMQNDYLAAKYSYEKHDLLNYSFEIDDIYLSAIKGAKAMELKDKEKESTFYAFSILMYHLIINKKMAEDQAYYKFLYYLNGYRGLRKFFSNVVFYDVENDLINYDLLEGDIIFDITIDGAKKTYKVAKDEKKLVELV